jgi:hypothetical protein
VDNNQGRHHLLDLRTGRTIKHRAITTIPITGNVIDLIQAMATNDNMKEGQKIESRAGTILCDSSWIAGVYYDITTESEEKDEEDENSDQNEDGPENHNCHELDTECCYFLDRHHFGLLLHLFLHFQW